MTLISKNFRNNFNPLLNTEIARAILMGLLFFSCSLSIKAENIRFKALDVNDGLPFNSVRAIVQDDLGYIWFGTELGLTKFDGYSLKSYLADNTKSNTIASPYILALEVDSNNILWVSSENGLNRYNRDTDDFTVFVHDENNSNSLSSNVITAIQKGADGILWVATDKGIDRFDTINNQFNHYTPKQPSSLSLINSNIRTLFRSKNGNVWIGSGKGLAVLNPSTGFFKAINLVEGEQPAIRSLA